MQEVLDSIPAEREAEIVGLTHWLQKELRPAHLAMVLRLVDLRVDEVAEALSTGTLEPAPVVADQECALRLTDHLIEAFPGFAPALRTVATAFLHQE